MSSRRLSKATLALLLWLNISHDIVVSGFSMSQVTRTSSSSSSFGVLSLRMAGGEGGDAEWAKALEEAKGEAPGSFDLEMQKMRGLMGKQGDVNPKLSQNAKLVEWLEIKGGVYLSDASTWGQAPHSMAISTETVDETTNETTGRGLLARRNINDGDELLMIPMTLCMTVDAARSTLGSDAIPLGTNEYLAIAVHLIYERFVKAEKSFWSSYIDILPEVEEVNPTFTWPDEDLSFLEGSPVVPATKSLQMKLKKEYDSFLGGKIGLCERFPDRFPKEVFTYENWVWAFTNLFSRAIRLRNLKEGEGLALVPYADLINHSPFSSAYIDAREAGDWIFKDGTEEIILYADRSYRKMEQIYISYGPKSNADLLLLYGFALERNPFNSVDVTVSILPRTQSIVDSIDIPDIEVDPLAEEKVAFLEQVGRENTVDFPCYADRYPIEMLEYLRLMQMTSDDTRGKALSEFDYSRTISAANEAAVLSSIIEAITRQLQKYPTSEDDDAMIIKDKGMFRLLNYNQRNAVRHRRNEKRLLKRTIAALEKQMRTRGLLEDGLERAGGSTLGQALPGDDRMYGDGKSKTALEDRLAKMGLPVDIR